MRLSNINVCLRQKEKICVASCLFQFLLVGTSNSEAIDLRFGLQRNTYYQTRKKEMQYITVFYVCLSTMKVIGNNQESAEISLDYLNAFLSFLIRIKNILSMQIIVVLTNLQQVSHRYPCLFMLCFPFCSHEVRQLFSLILLFSELSLLVDVAAVDCVYLVIHFTMKYIKMQRKTEITKFVTF